MQEFAETGAWLPPAAMATAWLVLGHQAGGLQRFLHEGVAEADAVFAPGQLVKVSDVEAQIALAIEGQQALHLGNRRPLGRRELPPTIQQTIVAVVLQPPAQAPDRYADCSRGCRRLAPT
jgi:hypothetical protein